MRTSMSLLASIAMLAGLVGCGDTIVNVSQDQDVDVSTNIDIPVPPPDDGVDDGNDDEEPPPPPPEEESFCSTSDFSLFELPNGDIAVRRTGGFGNGQAYVRVTQPPGGAELAVVERFAESVDEVIFTPSTDETGDVTVVSFDEDDVATTTHCSF